MTSESLLFFKVFLVESLHVVLSNNGQRGAAHTRTYAHTHRTHNSDCFREASQSEGHGTLLLKHAGHKTGPEQKNTEETKKDGGGIPLG